jgi:putative endonuclease
MFHVYILECNDKTLYVGSTNNLTKRLHEHNTKKNGAHYTKIRRPVRLVYTKECETYGEARKEEAALKRLSRKQKDELVKEQSIDLV